MIDMRTGLFILLFTYGFTIAYHVMGSTKFYMLKKFKWKKALLGIYQELGYFLFLFLIFILPVFVDLNMVGIDLQLDKIITIVLVFPLVGAIKKCYEKSIEVKKIDVSELDGMIESENGNILLSSASNKELNVNVTLKGDIDYGKKEQQTATKPKKPRG